MTIISQTYVIIPFLNTFHFNIANVKPVYLNTYKEATQMNYSAA